MAMLVATSNGGAQIYGATCLRSSVSGPGCFDRVEFDASSSVSPKRLPKRDLTPIALTIRGEIGLESGGHPPALREGIVDTDKDVTIDTVGLPACPLRRLRSLGTAEARQACREAIVGAGVAHIGFTSSEDKVTAPLTFFNGGTSDGTTRLFVHSAIAIPDPVSVIAVAKIRRRGTGLETTWRIPPILEGDGSLVDFRAKINRRFRTRGERQSYISARCPDEEFRAKILKALFRNETHAPGEPAQTMLKGSLSIPCAVPSG